MDLAQALLDGNRRALAQALTLVETGGPQARTLLSALFAQTGRAHIIGVTGAPAPVNRRWSPRSRRTGDAPAAR